MVEFDSTSHHVEHLQNWHIRGSIRQLENSKKKIMTIMIKRAHSWRSLKLEAQLVKRCTGIAEVMSLNPVQAWFFFQALFLRVRRSLSYLLLYLQFKYMTFMYSQLLINWFYSYHLISQEQVKYQSISRNEQGKHNDHLKIKPADKQWCV